MPQVPFTSFYLGPTAVYPTTSGLQDPITGAPQKGGNFQVGDYCDLSEADAQVWNAQYGTSLHQGRYRIVRLAAAATAANTGLGKPVGFGLGTQVAQVALSAAGSGYTNGTFTCVSTASGGTVKATAQVVVSGGAIISAVLLNPGSGFTSVPTFSLSELTGGTGGSILAQMVDSANFVCTFDAGAIQLSDVRGVFLGAVTSAQVTAGAYVIIQELGIAPVLVTTATNTAAGCAAAATTGAAVTTTPAGTAIPVGFFGYTLDLAAASTLVRVALRTPVMQG
jgi:hypothetical protein